MYFLFFRAKRGRLKHDHHFTFKSNNLAITLLTPSISGACVSESRPYAIYGSWLQILLPNDFVDEILNQLENINQLLKVNSLAAFRLVILRF
jgi:suppressor of fused-like protein